jgi:hypothetical protein
MAPRLVALPALVALVLLALAALAACGGGDPPPLDAACTGPPQAIEQALARAPAPVTLDSGGRLSDCIARARSDADLQNAGAALTHVADDLAARAQRGDVRAALGLGCLVGAARRGAARTNGIHAELTRRMESAARVLADGGPGLEAALRRGLRAGRATG